MRRRPGGFAEGIQRLVDVPKFGPLARHRHRLRVGGTPVQPVHRRPHRVVEGREELPQPVVAYPPDRRRHDEHRGEDPHTTPRAVSWMRSTSSSEESRCRSSSTMLRLPVMKNVTAQ